LLVSADAASYLFWIVAPIFWTAWLSLPLRQSDSLWPLFDTSHCLLFEKTENGTNVEEVNKNTF
jgi:hypothetical protein